MNNKFDKYYTSCWLYSCRSVCQHVVLLIVTEARYVIVTDYKFADCYRLQICCYPCTEIWPEIHFVFFIPWKSKPLITFHISKENSQVNDFCTIICMTEMNANGHCWTFFCQLFKKNTRNLRNFYIWSSADSMSTSLQVHDGWWWCETKRCSGRGNYKYLFFSIV